MASKRKDVSIETKIQKLILKDKLAYIELIYISLGLRYIRVLLYIVFLSGEL